MNTYTTEWTGEFPVLCHGEWKLYKNEEDISYLIPEDLKYDCMDCYGEYEEWEFDDEGQEHWNTYVDGYSETRWIKENKYWIKDIGPETDYPSIFKAFQKQDWRAGSCGGCI